MTKKDTTYVAVQFVLFLVFAGIGTNHQGSDLLKIGGLILAVVGLIIVGISILQLNKNLSPFPSPKAGSDLITSGLYAVVRHPIYFGIIVLFGGYSLYSASWLRLLVTGLLSILFHYKSAYEESLLVRKFPEYKTYQASTGKIFPLLGG
jgi:protein-S-isoprenylcysteine O-methyltransferase Ste14